MCRLYLTFTDSFVGFVVAVFSSVAEGHFLNTVSFVATEPLLSRVRALTAYIKQRRTRRDYT